MSKTKQKKIRKVKFFIKTKLRRFDTIGAKLQRYNDIVITVRVT